MKDYNADATSRLIIRQKAMEAAETAKKDALDYIRKTYKLDPAAMTFLKYRFNRLVCNMAYLIDHVPELVPDGSTREYYIYRTLIEFFHDECRMGREV